MGFIVVFILEYALLFMSLLDVNQMIVIEDRQLLLWSFNVSYSSSTIISEKFHKTNLKLSFTF